MTRPFPFEHHRESTIIDRLNCDSNESILGKNLLRWGIYSLLVAGIDRISESQIAIARISNKTATEVYTRSLCSRHNVDVSLLWRHTGYANGIRGHFESGQPQVLPLLWLNRTILSSFLPIATYDLAFRFLSPLEFIFVSLLFFFFLSHAVINQ